MLTRATYRCQIIYNGGTPFSYKLPNCEAKGRIDSVETCRNVRTTNSANWSDTSQNSDSIDWKWSKLEDVIKTVAGIRYDRWRKGTNSLTKSGSWQSMTKMRNINNIKSNPTKWREIRRIDTYRFQNLQNEEMKALKKAICGLNDNLACFKILLQMYDTNKSRISA